MSRIPTLSENELRCHFYNVSTNVSIHTRGHQLDQECKMSLLSKKTMHVSMTV